MVKLTERRSKKRWGEFPTNYLKNYFKQKDKRFMTVWVTASCRKPGGLFAVYDLSKVKPKYYYYRSK